MIESKITIKIINFQINKLSLNLANIAIAIK